MNRTLAIALTLALLAGAASPALAALCDTAVPAGAHACCAAGANPASGTACGASGGARLSRCCEAAPANDRGEPVSRLGASLAPAHRTAAQPLAVCILEAAPSQAAQRLGLVSTPELPLRL